MNYVNKIAKKTNKERKEAIIDILNNMNINYEIQKGKDVENIVVHFNPTLNEKKIVIGAHYDVVSGSNGYNDNASSCSILLKLINDYRNTSKKVDFVFFDLEEKIGVGSRYYIEALGVYDIDLMINLDVCGAGMYPSICPHQYKYDVRVQSFLDIEVMNKYDVKLLDDIAYGDNYSFAPFVPTVAICALNQIDVDIFNHKKSGLPPIMYTMHNQKNDNASVVKQEYIDKVYNYVKEALATIL